MYPFGEPFNTQIQTLGLLLRRRSRITVNFSCFVARFDRKRNQGRKRAAKSVAQAMQNDRAVSAEKNKPVESNRLSVFNC
jgi:hypothetical protein